MAAPDRGILSGWSGVHLKDIGATHHATLTMAGSRHGCHGAYRECCDPGARTSPGDRRILRRICAGNNCCEDEHAIPLLRARERKGAALSRRGRADWEAMG